jgi:hypothetical protein
LLLTLTSQSQELAKIEKFWDTTLISLLKVLLLLDLPWEPRQLTFTAEVNSGMRDSKLKRPFKKLMQRDSLVKTLVEVVMISMSTLKEELEHIFVVKNQLLLNL